ncbi:redoxin domain-containing protein [Flavobacteriaceae bacterium SZ-1-7]|uniref:redoxin domain-containing protein n=1 Tax=Tamlana sedimenti TaxID=3134126 RepID=UPI0031236934
MKIKLFSIAAVLLMSGCFNNKKSETVSVESGTKDLSSNFSKNIDLEVYDFNGFEKFLNKKDDKVYVINFWATWCAPCVKELPYFERLNAEFKDDGMEVILVSLDFPHLYENKLKPFIKERNLKSKVVALDDPDMNTWIPKVSESWTGAIPATIIYRNDHRKFYEQSFDFEELKTELNQFLNKNIYP